MKKPTPKKPKKRNPQDATLRNITALKKRIKKLEKILEKHGSATEKLVTSLLHNGKLKK